MLFPKLTRAWSGYIVGGQNYEIELFPSTGEVGINVIVLPPLTGSDYRVNLTHTDHRLYFTAGDVTVTDTRLECFKSFADYSFFREGFTVLLEPGMRDHLQVILPKLFFIADLSQRAEIVLASKLQELVHHRMEFAREVFAKIMLDGTNPDFAIELTKQYGLRTWDDEYVAAFESVEMRALLAEAQAVKPD